MHPSQSKARTRHIAHPKPSSGFMSRQQVAEEFGFSVSFLNQLPKSELPYYKRGGRAFYEREKVIAYIRGGLVTSDPEPAPRVPVRPGRPRKPVIAAAIASAR